LAQTTETIPSFENAITQLFHIVETCIMSADLVTVVTWLKRRVGEGHSSASHDFPRQRHSRARHGSLCSRAAGRSFTWLVLTLHEARSRGLLRGRLRWASPENTLNASFQRRLESSRLQLCIVNLASIF